VIQGRATCFIAKTNIMQQSVTTFVDNCEIVFSWDVDSPISHQYW